MRITDFYALTCTAALLAACSGKTTFGSTVDGLEGGDGTQMGAETANGSEGTQGNETASGAGTEGEGESAEQILETSSEPAEGGEMPEAVVLPEEEIPEGEGETEQEIPGEENTEEEEEPPSEYEPCAEKACGASCSTCAPDDEGCVETDIVRTCNADGACVEGTAECESELVCENAEECKAVTFAPEVCRVCSDGNVHCDGVDCVEGQCVVKPAEECEQRECEEVSECRREEENLVAPPSEHCKECPDGSQVCPEPACAENRCVERIPACEEEPRECSEDVPCPQLIGAPCRLCDDGTTACPTTECVEGRCVSEVHECPPREEYDPCAEKECGETCKQCDPENTSCIEITAVQACNAEGRCVLRTEDGPVCPE